MSLGLSVSPVCSSSRLTTDASNARSTHATAHGVSLAEAGPQCAFGKGQRAVTRRANSRRTQGRLASRVNAQAQQGTPGPDPPGGLKGVASKGQDWLQGLLARFGPMTARPANTAVLDFEKPLVELDNRIKEVRKVAEENGVDVSEQIKELEERARQLRRDTYNRLTAVQRLQVARHPSRPTFLDIALNITDKFIELHGDRAGFDDPALVCGLASMDGIPFMFIGHQKGRNTKENIHRNFGMPQPNGYRKALRFMQHANKHGFPIITFVDTPGAYAGKKAEELGQGEAIAKNLREMFSFRVPIISVVIGEGGSGGALAIGCANKNLILEHSVYYVASPEACAAILWKSRDATAKATEALRITAPELVKFGVFDEIIPEPLGGAHSDPMTLFPHVKEAIMRHFYNYAKMSEWEIKSDRYHKYRKIGLYTEDFTMAGNKEEFEEGRRLVAEKGSPYMTPGGKAALSPLEQRVLERMEKAEERWEEIGSRPEVIKYMHPAVEIDWDMTEDEAVEVLAEAERMAYSARNSGAVSLTMQARAGYLHFVKADQAARHAEQEGQPEAAQLRKDAEEALGVFCQWAQQAHAAARPKEAGDELDEAAESASTTTPSAFTPSATGDKWLQQDGVAGHAESNGASNELVEAGSNGAPAARGVGGGSSS